MTETATHHRNDRRFTAPLLSVRAASIHLGVTTRTMTAWILTRDKAGIPLVHAVPPALRAGPRLPFVALAEAQVLQELGRAGLSRVQICALVTRFRARTGDEHVLATRALTDDHGEMFTNAVEAMAGPRLKPTGTLGRTIRDGLRTHIRYGDDGVADRLLLRPYGKAHVILDPRFGFGQPVLGTSKIRVDLIADMFFAGDSLAAVATAYEVSIEEVESVIRVLGRGHAG